MEDACCAVFYHSCSHDGNPQHERCPKGSDSWCPYARAVANAQKYSHTKPPAIPPDLAPFVKECWLNLCDCNLLKCCTLGATQNQNESFTKLVWKYCPKTDFCSPTTVCMAVQLAILTFNKGLVSLVPLLEGLGPEGIGPYCKRYLLSHDVARLKRATVKTSKHVKKKKKSLRRKKS